MIILMILRLFFPIVTSLIYLNNSQLVLFCMMYHTL